MEKRQHFRISSHSVQKCRRIFFMSESTVNFKPPLFNEKKFLKSSWNEEPFTSWLSIYTVPNNGISWYFFHFLLPKINYFLLSLIIIFLQIFCAFFFKLSIWLGIFRSSTSIFFLTELIQETMHEITSRQWEKRHFRLTTVKWTRGNEQWTEKWMNLVNKRSLYNFIISHLSERQDKGYV